MGIDRRPSNIQSGDEFWIDVQKKAFTRWANSHLKELPITDLYQDLSDGLRLIALLDELSEHRFTAKYNKEPRYRIHKLENLNLVFGFLAKEHVLVTNIGSSDILDGNSKLILGLMWTIIKRYQVADIAVDGVSGKDGLLLWCNQILEPYELHVSNFTTHWSNGLAFCYLLHAYDATLVNLQDLSPDHGPDNLALAFSLLETHLAIPSLLSPEDLQGKVDEKSVLTYVSMVFQAITKPEKKSTEVPAAKPVEATADEETTATQDATQLAPIQEESSLWTSIQTYEKAEETSPPLIQSLVSTPAATTTSPPPTKETPVSFAALSPVLTLLYPVRAFKLAGKTK
ncbi:hypothetical protein LEN26_000277 [Aphanomyces euteiches]|nr:hypothetical protein AeMF1_020259 [Aphanomyces euteiches]KAH9163918.1 hypothetical protein LEN26_000277 [Aphanomyces euteiches]